MPQPISEPNRCRLAACIGASCIGLAAASAFPAAGQAHEALVITNPTSVVGLQITNTYAALRGLPPNNVLLMDPAAADFDELVDVKFEALFGTIANRRLGRSIDYVILGPGTGYEVPAPGLISDSCAPVTTFSLPGAYSFAKFADTIRAGGNGSLLVNGYATTQDDSQAFDSNETYQNGSPGGSIVSGDLFIGVSLGYSGQRGVNAPTMLDMIDRSLIADGGSPTALFYFMETDDAARSSPRDNGFPFAVDRIVAGGGNGVVQFGSDLPTLGFPALGIMTGTASFDFDDSAAALEPGAFADHLTSFGADFNRGQQTKISEWIRGGAVGSFGAVEEPCNYAQKFPSAFMHSHYFAGLTMGEAVYRSLGAVPFQGYLMGDPLCRPFATGPTVDLPTLPPDPVIGLFSVTPTVSATRPGTAVASVQVLIDGVLVAEGAPGTFLVPTNHLDDGWHELRIVAVDDSPQAVSGEWVGSFTLANRGLSASITPNQTNYNRTATLTFDVAGSGGPVTERRVVHLGRVVAAAGPTGTLQTRGEVLGAGPAIVRAEVDFADGSTARSEPVQLSGVTARPTPTITPVVAMGFTTEAAPGEPFAVELPADFADDADAMTYGIVTQPAQASLLGGEGPVRIFSADPTAAGTDTITFSVSNGQTTDTATITVRYRDVPVPCLADVNRDGEANSSDFFAWVVAYTNDDPAADQNGDGAFGASQPLGASDFFALIVNLGQGCMF